MIAVALLSYAALLLTLERVSAPGHPTTLSICANVAYWTGLAGDAAGARDVYAALLPAMERILGPEHPDTWVVRKNLASWTEKVRRRGVK